MSALEFEGLSAVVTGGASGIGLATATRLADRGARVAVLDREIGGLSDRFIGLAADVTDTASVNAAVAAATDVLGGLDVLVNNAGIGAIGTVADNDDDEWARVLNVNVIGIARVTRAALPALLEDGDLLLLLGAGDIGATALELANHPELARARS